MIRFWNRVVSHDNSRLPRQLLKWDINCKGNTWSSDIKSLLFSIDQVRAFQTRNMDCTKAAWVCLHETYCNQWKIESLYKPKLRTYVKFKTCFKIEDYLMSFMSCRQKTYLAQLICGILPLHIETGRWYGVKEEDRLSQAGNNDQIENEYHFIFYCNAYSTLKTTFYHQISSVMPTLIDNNDEDKLNLLMNKEHVNLFSRYICDIYKIRQDILFKENVWQMCTL